MFWLVIWAGCGILWGRLFGNRLVPGTPARRDCSPTFSAAGSFRSRCLIFGQEIIVMKKFTFLAALVICASVSQGGDWAHWRGPLFNGSCDETNLPVKWSQTENVAWAADLPGASAATPVVSGDRVFITSADAEKETLLAMCFDRRTGKLLWEHESPGPIRRDYRSNFAAPSAVTDGKIVVFFFSTGQLTGYDFDGERIWSRNIKKDYGTFAFLWTLLWTFS